MTKKDATQPTDENELENNLVVDEPKAEEKPIVDVENSEEEDVSEEAPKTEALDEEDTADKLEVKASYDAKTKIAVASTDVVDRHGEKISQEGWDLKNFKANPVMLWAHDHSEIAVGNARNIHIERAGGTPRLVFTPDFHDKTPTAKALKSLFEEGWLNSFSVGFMPKDFDGKSSTYLKQELLEISAVNVPANPDARMMSYKSLMKKGFEETVAKEVTGIEADEADEKEVRSSFVEIMKGALADEIEADQMMKHKYEMTSKLHEVYWAFCDVYYDEETPVEDFSKLLAEFVVEINKLMDMADDMHGENPDDMPMDMPEDKQVIDNITEKSETENKTTETDKANVEVKEQGNKETSSAPTINNQEARAKQSLTKIIAKASDKLLENKADSDTVKYAKVIKRAAEILNKAHKN